MERDSHTTPSFSVPNRFFFGSYRVILTDLQLVLRDVHRKTGLRVEERFGVAVTNDDKETFV